MEPSEGDRNLAPEVVYVITNRKIGNPMLVSRDFQSAHEYFQELLQQPSGAQLYGMCIVTIGTKMEWING